MTSWLRRWGKIRGGRDGGEGPHSLTVSKTVALTMEEPRFTLSKNVVPLLWCLVISRLSSLRHWLTPLRDNYKAEGRSPFAIQIEEQSHNHNLLVRCLEVPQTAVDWKEIGVLFIDFQPEPLAMCKKYKMNMVQIPNPKGNLCSLAVLLSRVKLLPGWKQRDYFYWDFGPIVMLALHPSQSRITWRRALSV